MDYIKIVEANVNLSEGRQMIEKFMATLYFKTPMANKKMARSLCLPIPVVTAIKKEFIKLGLIRQFKGMTLTDKGQAYVEDYMGYKSIDVKGHQALLDGETDQVLALYKSWCQGRPEADVKIDQAHCSQETSVRRALLALKGKCLVGKNVVCVGDDDLVCLALASIIKTLFPGERQTKTRIHVLDVDPRLIAFIEGVANCHDLPIQCHQGDLRQGLPEALEGLGDCFFTDPPYTLQGLDLFLSRGISTLKPLQGLPIFLSFGHVSYDEGHGMMARLVGMGLTIETMTPRFNHYEGASILGSISQMLVLKTSSHTRASIQVQTPYNDKLYTRSFKGQNNRCNQD